MFDTTKEDLKDILKKVDGGKLQLPDFQRDYVWEDDDVQSLIASIAKGFPVGALLTLETGGVVSFKPRTLAGVDTVNPSPEELLLDGQQRMTSLFQSMHCKRPVRTRIQNRVEVERFYYLDIIKAASDAANIEQAIVPVPADRIIRSNFGRTVDLDLTTAESEYEHDLFPLNQVFDHTDWYFGWRGYWKTRNPDRFDIESKFFKGIVENIQRYKMPIIRLDKKNSREAICLVFEKVNVGGKKLDAFELVTAIYAASNFDLREDWKGTVGNPSKGRIHRMIGTDSPRRVLKHIQSTDFLQACALLHTREVRLQKAAAGVKDSDLPQISCKRETLLGLPLTAYRAHADNVEAGFIEAAGVFNELKIILAKDVPYPPQIVAAAATLAILGDAGQNAMAREKIAQWFWSVALGEQYGSSTEFKLSRDVPQLVNWIMKDGPTPQAIEGAYFQQDRLRSLRTRLSAAYKAIHALIMRKGCQDFINGKGFELMTFYNDKVDVHHIFPQAWSKKAGIPQKVYDSIVNKTPLSKKSNILIGGDAPSVYLKRIESKHGLTSDRLDAILRTHLIEPQFLRADNFQGFFDARLKALSGLIGGALNKTVVESHGSNEVEVEVDDLIETMNGDSDEELMTA
ncbi:MAG: DUF262 domain-containing protein [Planctomycetota bacterium]